MLQLVTIFENEIYIALPWPKFYSWHQETALIDAYLAIFQFTIIHIETFSRVLCFSSLLPLLFASIQQTQILTIDTY